MTRNLLRWYACLVLVFASGCATTPPASVVFSDTLPESVVENLFPRNISVGLPDQNLRKGIASLYANDLTEASAQFNQALRQNPQNSQLQLLNGLAYHLMAEAGDTKQYDLAKVGYQLALKFDKNNWLAAMQLGRLYLKTKNYPLAQENFAYALLYQPDNASLLYGLAQASYFARDLETASGAIKRAQPLSPDDPNILAASALIAAATGSSGDARRFLELYLQRESHAIRSERVVERVNDWLRIHEARPKIVLASDTAEPVGPTPADPEKRPSEISTAGATRPEPSGPRMAIIDVVMIRTEENESSNKGVNLLDGLKLQFSDTFFSFKDTLTRDLKDSTNTTHEREWVASSMLSVADVTYNMNIFNVSEDKTEVLARPTLVATEGQKSDFFSGGQIIVALTGEDSGSLEKVDVGVKLEVTPTFISDDLLQISVSVGRTFVDLAAGRTVKTLAQTFSISKNEVNANVALKFGQSLILSGLREKETSEVKSGVPFLRDLPLVQYLFSNEQTLDVHKSIITILTPRRVLPGVYLSPEHVGAGEQLKEEAGDHPHLKELRRSTASLLTIDDNINQIMRHLGKHRVFREFRETDLFDSVWYGSSGDLRDILKKSISFLYY